MGYVRSTQTRRRIDRNVLAWVGRRLGLDSCRSSCAGARAHTSSGTGLALSLVARLALGGTCHDRRALLAHRRCRTGNAHGHEVIFGALLVVAGALPRCR